MRSAVREESYNSVIVFWLDTDFIVKELRQKAEQLIRNKQVHKVVLFGSQRIMTFEFKSFLKSRFILGPF